MTHLARLALLPCLCAVMLGCAWFDDRPRLDPDFANRLPLDLDQAIMLEVALLERPRGDRLLDAELWSDVDQTVMNLDQRVALNANGLWVGRVIGVPSGAFQSVLTSRQACSNPRQLVIPMGKTTPISLATDQGTQEYRVRLTDLDDTRQLDKVAAFLDVTPKLTAPGRASLRCTPRLEHGAPHLPFRPDIKTGNWVPYYERSAVQHDELAWEVALEPNAMLLVGTRSDKPGTAGCVMFLGAEGKDVQRLLVIRCSRLPRVEANQAEEPSKVTPLAQQARDKK